MTANSPATKHPRRRSPGGEGRFTPLLDDLSLAFRAGDKARTLALVAQLREVADAAEPPGEARSDQFEIVV